MIPKRIHYCWFGGHPLRKLEEMCLESWKRNCPDYELVLWNEGNAPIKDNVYVRQAFQMKKWAFVSDYVRLKVLSEYGGIYLDTDVELLKPLNDFMNQRGFLGLESRENIASCVIGCVPHHPFFSWAAGAYDERAFCTADGTCDETTNTTWLTGILLRMGLQQTGLQQVVADVEIYPPDIFCPFNLETGKLRLTDRSVAIHHFAGSWMTPRQKFHTRVAQILGVEKTKKLRKLLG